MKDPARERIAAAFERELSSAPVPGALRSTAVRAAVRAPQKAGLNRFRMLPALVAVLLAAAIVATLVIASHLARTSPQPVGPGSQPPAPRPDAGFVYDGAHGQFLVFGGNGMPGSPTGDTWTWDAKGWTHQRPATSPAGRMDPAVAYDAARHVVVLFGGRGQGAQARPQPVDLSDTWTWDGHDWRRRRPAHSPSLNYDWPAAMGYDPVSRTVLLFGFAKVASGSTTTMTPQTWSWNGSDWTQLNPAVTPRSTGDMFSDGSHLFLTTPPSTVDTAHSNVQMSEWDGRSWVPVASENSLPTDSGLMSAAYDLQRHELVVLNGDTWTWAQSRWLRVHPGIQPPTGCMAYFAALHEVVSWGERWGTSSNAMFAWDGKTWRTVEPGNVVPSPAPSGAPTTVTALSPAAAAALIHKTVTSTSPVLLPASLPPGMDANVAVSPEYFSVTYRTDQRDKEIGLVTDVGNPGPGSAASSDRSVPFRHAMALKYRPGGYAEYFVYDPTDPTSNRWLMWIEPGTMSVGGTPQSGVPYFLFARGLTDAEFWQVANSLG